MTDRELDALVAEHIFGCKPIPTWNGRYRCGCSDDDSPVSHDIPDHRFGSVLFSGPRGLYQYSTDIRAAWTVVEKLTADFEAFDIRQVPDDELGVTLWVVESHRTVETDLDNADFGCRNAWGAEDHSITRAICLAAIKAAGVEVPV